MTRSYPGVMADGRQGYRGLPGRAGRSAGDKDGGRG
jgi:hypothetical protein